MGKYNQEAAPSKSDLVAYVAEAIEKTQYLGKFSDTKEQDLAIAKAATENPEGCDLAALIAVARRRQATFSGSLRVHVETAEIQARKRL